MVDTDGDKEDCHDNIEPTLEGLQASDEFSQVVHAVCNEPCHGKYGNGGGKGEDDGQEISATRLRRHGNQHPEIDEGADGTEGKREESAEEKRSEKSGHIVAPCLNLAVVMVMMEAVTEEHGHSDDDENGCQQRFAPPAHRILQVQKVASAVDNGNQDGAKQGISHRAAEDKDEALPKNAVAGTDVAADEADGGDIAAQRTGRHTGEKSEKECRDGRDFRGGKE